MVCILLGAGFEESEALVPADLLRRAGVEVALTALEGREVPGGHGITVRADLSLDQVDPGNVELIFLPGGLGGVEAISSCPQALDLVRQLYGQGRYVAAICAAPTILAGLGLLEGRKAVCYPGMEAQLTGAVLQKGTPVVEDGTIITGEAAGSAFSFGLRLVELLRGPAVAAKIRESVHYHG